MLILNVNAIKFKNNKISMAEPWIKINCLKDDYKSKQVPSILAISAINIFHIHTSPFVSVFSQCQYFAMLMKKMSSTFNIFHWWQLQREVDGERKKMEALWHFQLLLTRINCQLKWLFIASSPSLLFRFNSLIVFCEMKKLQ